MKQIVTAIACSLSLTACVTPGAETKPLPLTATQLDDIKETASYNFRDPRAAQFRNIRHVEITRPNGKVSTLVCGEINGKNAFGAYAGFTTFKGNFEGDDFRLHGVGTQDNNWIYVAACPRTS